MNETPLPAWLTHLVDQRLALVEDKLGSEMLAAHLIMTPLTEPAEHASAAEHQRWDRTCDHCGKYCETEFYTGSVQRELRSGHPVIMTFGVCAACKW